MINNGREPKTEQESNILIKCYKKGMTNGWASGQYDMAYGSYISEDDRLNKKSILFIDNIDDLEKFFLHGNWCLGTGIIFKNLFFLNQVDGGDEWATYKISDEIFQFESITFIGIINDGKFNEYSNRMLIASDEQLLKCQY